LPASDRRPLALEARACAPPRPAASEPAARPGYRHSFDPSPGPVSPASLPFVCWGQARVWLFVLLTPGAALVPHLLDDSALAIVTPLVWVLAALFVVALTLAMIVSVTRSAYARSLATVGSLAAVALVL
jgi:hypothetical protein